MDLSLKEGEKIVLQTEEGQKIIFDKEDWEGLVEKKQKEKAHIHIEVSKALKQKWIDAINKNAELKSLKSLIKNVVEEYLNNLKPMDKQFAGLVGVSSRVDQEVKQLLKKKRREIKKIADDVLNDKDFIEHATLQEVLNEITKVSGRISKLTAILDILTQIATQVNINQLDKKENK